MDRLWGILSKDQKIIKNHTITLAPLDFQDQILTGLENLCLLFDIARPIIMDKHWTELEHFQHTRFKADHFSEPFSYDYFEIRIILEDKTKSHADKTSESWLS